MTRTPARDTSGRFTVPNLPWWQRLALKLLGKVAR